MGAARKARPATGGKMAKKKTAAVPAVVVVRRMRQVVQDATDGAEELMGEAAALAQEADRAVDFAKRVGTFLGRVAQRAKRGGR